MDALDGSPIFTTVIVLNLLTSFFCDLGPEYLQSDLGKMFEKSIKCQKVDLAARTGAVVVILFRILHILHQCKLLIKFK